MLQTFRQSSEQVREFKEKYLFFRKDSLIIPPEVKPKVSAEWGQLKNLISLFQFLNYYWTDISDNPEMSNPTLVYVGAAPGNHLYLACQAWDKFTFHLYDECDVDPRLQTLKNVIIHDKNFDLEDAEKWARYSEKYKNLYFIFDIRHNEWKKDLPSELKNELLRKDLEFQRECIRKILPYKCMMKIRFPDDVNYYDYFDGLALRLTYTDKTCEEFNLILADGIETRRWNMTDLKKAFDIHNNYVKHFNFKFGEAEESRYISKKLGIKIDYDGIVLYLTFKCFLSKFPRFVKNKPSKDDILRVIERTLKLILPDGRNKLIPKKVT